MVPNEAAISSHVSAVRSRTARSRRGRARRRARSGMPRFAVSVSPGTGNANESRSKTPVWCSTIVFVGPRKTESASTHGMIIATTTTHETSSNKSERASRRTSPRRASRTTPVLATPGTRIRPRARRSTSAAIQRQDAWRRGSNSPTVANTAGITSVATIATSHHNETSGSRVCRRSTTSAPRRLRRARRCATGSIWRQLRPPRAERFERVPELCLLVPARQGMRRCRERTARRSSA